MFGRSTVSRRKVATFQGGLGATLERGTWGRLWNVDLGTALERRTWGRLWNVDLGTTLGLDLGDVALWNVFGATWERLWNVWLERPLEWYARFGKQGEVSSLSHFACWGNPQTPRIFCENSNPFLAKWKNTSLRSVQFLERKKAKKRKGN